MTMNQATVEDLVSIGFSLGQLFDRDVLIPGLMRDADDAVREISRAGGDIDDPGAIDAVIAQPSMATIQEQILAYLRSITNGDLIPFDVEEVEPQLRRVFADRYRQAASMILAAITRK
jgi:hypothetical protein